MPKVPVKLFHVTNFDLENPPKNEDGSINYKEDFFGQAYQSNSKRATRR